MSYRKRVDKNQSQFTAELRKLGFSVAHTHTLGKGFPDLAIGWQRFTWLVELKSGAADQLNGNEWDWWKNWRGSVFKTHSALDFLKQLENWFEQRNLIQYLPDIEMRIKELERQNADSD